MDERDGLHKTVLAEEAVSALNIQSAGFYIDATFGRGQEKEIMLIQYAGVTTKYDCIGKSVKRK